LAKTEDIALSSSFSSIAKPWDNLETVFPKAESERFENRVRQGVWFPTQTFLFSRDWSEERANSYEAAPDNFGIAF
jgi:hypothetical protein